MVNLEDRCPTGIPGLDDLIEGGFPRGRSILISGTCGTGKSTFGVQFLYNGVKDYNEPGILVTLEQNPEELKKDMLRYGFDLEGVEREEKLLIIDSRAVVSEFGSIAEIIISKAREINAKRAVIDSIGAMDFLSEGKYDIRKTLLSINNMLKEYGLTTLILVEVPEDSESLSAYGVESYVLDGVVKLTIHEALDSRKIEIRKMRATHHSIKSREIEFTDHGIVVVGEEKEKKPKKSIFL
jgi:KaiC/GvpD/RAD55 family RecA-like ATPase